LSFVWVAEMCGCAMTPPPSTTGVGWWRWSSTSSRCDQPRSASPARRLYGGGAEPHHGEVGLLHSAVGLVAARSVEELGRGDWSAKEHGCGVDAGTKEHMLVWGRASSRCFPWRHRASPRCARDLHCRPWRRPSGVETRAHLSRSRLPWASLLFHAGAEQRMLKGFANPCNMGNTNCG
jgi:hypothetical protein